MNEIQDNRQHELDLGIPAAQEELAKPVRDEADHGPADVMAASSAPTIDKAKLDEPNTPEVKEVGDAAPARTPDPIEPPVIDEAGHEEPRAPEALGVKNPGTTRTADPLEPFVIDDAALSRLAAKRRRESEEARLKLGIGTSRDEAEATSPKAEDTLQKSQGRDDAVPTPPESTSTREKEDRGQKDREDEQEFVTPESLRKRYLQADTKFYYRNQDNKLAFEIQGRRLATEHNDPEVAKSMVELAQAQGWQSIKLKGTEEFKREVWLQASLRGMTTQGYEPRDVDLSKLADMRTELDRGAGKARNIVEATVSKNRDAEGQNVQKDQRVQEEHRRRPTVAARRGGLAIDEHHQTLSPKERQALDTLTRIQRQRGDSPEAIGKTADAMAERFQKRRVHVGRVLQHGHAPYDNDPQNEGSYYVTLRTAAGSKTVWGVDLERALAHAGSGVGDEVALAYQGRVEVGVVRNAHGEQAPKYRNAWQVRKLEYLREDEKKHLVQAARSAERQPLLKVYDRSADRAEPRPEPVREPVRDLDRTRAGRG
jgi:hypothetical protein